MAFCDEDLDEDIAALFTEAQARAFGIAVLGDVYTDNGGITGAQLSGFGIAGTGPSLNEQAWRHGRRSERERRRSVREIERRAASTIRVRRRRAAAIERALAHREAYESWQLAKRDAWRAMRIDLLRPPYEDERRLYRTGAGANQSHAQFVYGAIVTQPDRAWTAKSLSPLCECSSLKQIRRISPGNGKD